MYGAHFSGIDRQYYVAQLPGLDPQGAVGVGWRWAGAGGCVGVDLFGILPLYDLSLRKMKAEDHIRFLITLCRHPVDL